jgi:hypothetical protein
MAFRVAAAPAVRGKSGPFLCLQEIRHARPPGPTLTSPQMVASDATQAEGSIFGFLSACVINICFCASG